MKRSLATIATGGLFILTACGDVGRALPSESVASVPGSMTTTSASDVGPPAADQAPSSADRSQPAGRVAGLPRSPLLEQIRELPAAGGLPDAVATARPLSISYGAIGVKDAPIEAVGVESNGEMEIPGAKAVGWYEFGPTPGQPGSAVLAAHIAFDGERGVFRSLADSQENDTFTLSFDDGTTFDYRVIERAQYDKDQLPFDRIFAKSGPPVITLVSCGGTFQQSLASYQDNIVAYAIPVI